MDISPPLSTPDAQTAFATSDVFARMLQDMAAAIPIRDLDTPQRIAQRHEDARTMAAALHPADVIEAATAVLATVAYYASLALHACAAQPGQTAREATALCRVALAEHRSTAPASPIWPSATPPPNSHASAPSAPARPRSNPNRPTTTRSLTFPSSSPATATATRSPCIATRT